ncbi:MAG: glutamate mutase L [Firmicutes bacterium]|nr:glutamate mutase L [Bacillota bacterium]
MKIDVLVAEIGSTTTIVSAFDHISSNNPIFLGQGFAPTTVKQGDVTIGLHQAIDDLKHSMNVDDLEAIESFACSSAAGGLKMSVHGLVYDMTVKAAKEACLGAGANLKLITAGLIDVYQLALIRDLKLNIIMIAGGVDYGESDTALENAKKIASLHLNIPVIYAGNIQNHDAIKAVFKKENQLDYLTISQNVYPKIDVLQVEEARKIIQSVFEKHIINAPGMEKVRDTINQNIIPTPGAVMEASILLQKEIGDLVTIDIGGATSDIHSVTSGLEENQKKLISPEPFAKRTVEGDLGVYVNKDNIIEMIGRNELAKELNLDTISLNKLLSNYLPIPSFQQIPLVRRLTLEALNRAIERHAGHYIHLYGASGKTTLTEGKDLSAVKTIIGTGGALTKITGGKTIIFDSLNKKSDLLLKPNKETTILLDTLYIMGACGVLAKKYPEAARILLLNSLK